MFCVCASLPLLLVLCWRFEVGAGIDGVEVPEGDFAEASVAMVDWEEEREKVLASGARCVSFNSVVCQRHGVESGWCACDVGVDRWGGHWRRRTLGELPRHSDSVVRGCRCRYGKEGRCGRRG
jgi:hypothetical protein